MSQRQPCPNPMCVHQFDPAELAGAASVTCPSCGLVIQLRASPAAIQTAPPPAVPMARPVNAEIVVFNCTVALHGRAVEPLRAQLGARLITLVRSVEVAMGLA